MYIRVVILLRTFNPPNVAELKIDHVSLVFWYKHFDRRLMRVLFLRTVQPYQQFPDINSLLYRPKIARELTIPRSNDPTARDRSPVHGLRGIVCFR